MPKRGEDEALKNESQPEAQSEEPEEIPENEPPVEDNDETEPPADEPTPVKSDTKSPPSPPEPCIPTLPKPKPPPPNPRREPSLPPVFFKIYAQCNTSLASGFRGVDNCTARRWRLRRIRVARVDCHGQTLDFLGTHCW